jgi:hypothetical protein
VRYDFSCSFFILTYIFQLDDWPWYTNLIKGRKREILLSIQTHEVKAVVRKAMHLIEARFRFENPFPGQEDRISWYYTELHDACAALESTSRGVVKFKYDDLRKRVVADEKYVNDLSTLVRSSSLALVMLTVIAFLAWSTHQPSTRKHKDNCCHQHTYRLWPSWGKCRTCPRVTETETVHLPSKPQCKCIPIVRCSH